MFQTKFVERIKTHILCTITLPLPPKKNSGRLGENVAKYGIDRQTTDDNMAHAHCMLANHGYRHTHSEYVILIAFPIQHWLQERASMYCLYVQWLAWLTAARSLLKNKNWSDIYMSSYVTPFCSLYVHTKIIMCSHCRKILSNLPECTVSWCRNPNCTYSLQCK
jgi:hypothetical protein